MRLNLSLVPTFLIFTLLFTQAPIARKTDRWGVANYRGLIIGKSRRSDMLRRFGNPKWSQTKPERRDEEGKEDREREPQRLTWNNYEAIGEFPGITNIATSTRTGVITRIDFFPEGLTKSEAIAHFGPNYVVTRYDFDTCDHDEDRESLYESPYGSLLAVEYRAQGIVLVVQANEIISKIRYVKGPIGSLTSKCPKNRH
jgi:hypothetical protein